jgi:hypothetical protein
MTEEAVEKDEPLYPLITETLGEIYSVLNQVLSLGVTVVVALATDSVILALVSYLVVPVLLDAFQQGTK